MKRFSLWLLAMAVATALLACSKGKFSAGQEVAAKWQATSWYTATIAAKNGDKWDVSYGDGDKGTLAETDIVPLSADAKFNVNDHVIAQWKGAKMYPGVVTKANGATYTVKWDDGDVPLDVPASKIMPFR